MRYVSGDLLDFPVIAHGCNCRSTMGAGVAGQLARKYPAMFAAYSERCWEGIFTLGRMFRWDAPGQTVYNLATQDYPGKNGDLTAITRSVLRMVQDVPDRTDIAVPLIGCGIAGLNWREVGGSLAKIENAFQWATFTVVLWPGDVKAYDQVVDAGVPLTFDSNGVPFS